eukprot:13425-Heterococcus_DN1.PRE.1
MRAATLCHSTAEINTVLAITECAGCLRNKHSTCLHPPQLRLKPNERLILQAVASEWAKVMLKRSTVYEQSSCSLSDQISTRWSHAGYMCNHNHAD